MRKNFLQEGKEKKKEYVGSSSFLPGLSIKFPSGEGLVGLWSILHSAVLCVHPQEGRDAISHRDSGGVGEPRQGCQSFTYVLHYKCHHW